MCQLINRHQLFLFLAIAVAISAFASPVSAAEDSQELPRVLLIGDSISIGYTPFVKKHLAGVAEVHRIPGNAGHTGMGIANLPKWLKAKPGPWDVIHFNWGLWDLCYRNPESKTQGRRDKVNGTLTHTPKQYAENLEKLVSELKKTGATLIWASTTPVPDGEAGRKVGDDKIYNEAAEQVMRRHKIPTNDLHRLILPKMKTLAVAPGNVHFKKEGSELLGIQVANTIKQTLVNKAAKPQDEQSQADVDADDLQDETEPTAKKTAVKTSQWNGFKRLDFVLGNRKCWLVLPAKAAAGRPWIWRARFFGHQPQADIALLKKGFHLAYCDVGGLFGSPTAVKHWNTFYEFATREYQLSEKVALEGMSRGGLIIYNWAVANPQRVSCIYGDAPVCDFKSWPGGKGQGKGSAGTWKQCLAAYGLSEEEALNYDGNPIDRLAPLAKAGVPLLHVVGEADVVVPVSENTNILAERYEKLGGRIRVIRKPGVGHHPHSLQDPAPIVDFVLAATKSD